MIYNPFLQPALLANYIDDFKITVSDTVDYSLGFTMAITVNNDSVVFQVFQGTSKLTEIITEYFSQEGLIKYSDGCIFLSMRKPPVTLDETELSINPCVVEFLGSKDTCSTVRTNLFVNKPLNVIRSQNKLTLELLPDNDTTYTELEGLTRINGIGPDSNGNLNIISKSPEVTVEVNYDPSI